MNVMTPVRFRQGAHKYHASDICETYQYLMLTRACIATGASFYVFMYLFKVHVWCRTRAKQEADAAAELQKDLARIEELTAEIR